MLQKIGRGLHFLRHQGIDAAVVQGVGKVVAPPGRLQVGLAAEIDQELITVGPLALQAAVPGEEPHSAKLYSTFPHHSILITFISFFFPDSRWASFALRFLLMNISLNNSLTVLYSFW